MRALITGAGGFLGAWLAKALAARGDTVTCLFRPGGDASALAGVTYTRVEGDVTDRASLAPAVVGQDVVFHLAGVRRARDARRLHARQRRGHPHLCDAMVAAGARPRLVLAGSLAAMGPSTPERPHVEEDPFHPQEWYGESKAEAERIAFSYADRLEVTVTRPPRILGPGDRENLAFFKLVKKRHPAGAGRRPPPAVAWWTWRTWWTCMLLLAERPEAVGEAFFCAGPGEPLTLEQMQDLVAEALGLHPRTVRLRPGGAPGPGLGGGRGVAG